MYKIIGIGGLPRSGKDTLAELLTKKGYFGFSIGDVFRNVSRGRHADKPDPISVANMTETSNWLRETKGPDFALKEAIRDFEEAGGTAKHKGLVVYSVRAPAEADFILKSGGQLIWVDADDEVRYKRAMRKMREGEANISLEEFKRQEALQSRPQPGLPADFQMNTNYIKSRATKVIKNNGSDVEAFKKEAEKVLNNT